MNEKPLRFNPFPGLRPFEADEDHLFFGRERHTDELVRRLRHNRFLAVVGGSGSGKSSLVRSGLIPALYGGMMARAGSRWRIALMRPGEDPIGKLADALSETRVVGQAGTAPETNRAMIEATLRSSPRGLVDVVQQARLPEYDNVLVVVDQFEELFRFRGSRKGAARDDAVAFVKLLLAAAGEPDSAYAAITMRADFVGHCMDYPGLPEGINTGQYLIPRMSRDELRRAITGPVAVGGGEITPRLVTRLLNEVGDDPNLLPVLQHALMRTWDHWDGNGASGAMDTPDYAAIGTITRALSQHAEEAYLELGSEAKREVARAVFQGLTETDEEGRAVRRPSRVEQLSASSGASEGEVVEVVECFRRRGRAFLTPPAGVALRPESIIDLSHENLIRVWERLGKWVRQEAESAGFYRRLSDCALENEAGTESLWRHPELALGLRWLKDKRHNAAWAERHGGGFERAVRFVENSRRADRRRKAALLGSVALGVVLALGIVVTYALAQRENNRLLAKTNRALEEKDRDLSAQVAGLERGNRQAGGDLGGLIAQTRKLEAEFDAASAERNRKAAEVQELRASRELLTGNQRELLAQKESEAAQIGTLESQVDSLIGRAAQLRDQNGVLKARLQALLLENTRLNAKLRSLGIEPPVVGDRGAPAPPPQPSYLVVQRAVPAGQVVLRPQPLQGEQRLDELSKENRRLRLQAARLQQESGQLASSLGVYRAENSALEKQVAAVRAEGRKLTVEAGQVRNETAKLRAAVTQLEDELRVLRERAANLRTRESELQFQIATVRTENATMNERMASVSAENDRWSERVDEATKAK